MLLRDHYYSANKWRIVEIKKFSIGAGTTNTPLPVFTRRSDGGMMFCTWPFVCPSVRPSVRYQTREQANLKTNEPTLLLNGTRASIVHEATKWNGQLCGSGGQRSRSHNAWVKFVGLGRVQQLTGLLLFFFTLGINDPEGFEKKLGY